MTPPQANPASAGKGEGPLVIRDRAPTATDLPKVQTVLIGDLAQGEIAPFLYSDGKLCWHASIKPVGTRIPCHLLQGFGDTPLAAVKDALESEYAEIEARSATLAKLERVMREAGAL